MNNINEGQQSIVSRSHKKQIGKMNLQPAFRRRG